MASASTHISMANRSMLAALTRLGELLGVEPPVLPSASRHGTEHMVRQQWERLHLWLLEQSPITETMITVDVVDEPEGAPTVTGVADATGHIVTFTEEERLASILEAASPATEDADPVTETVDAEPDEYAGMTKRELLALAEERGVTVIGTGDRGYIKNEDIVEALQNAAANG